MTKKSHICGDPNEACDSDCLNRAYDFQDLRAVIAELRAEVQRLQSQNCELESILAAIAVAKSGEVSDFMESFGIVRDIRDLCLRAEAAESSLARVEAELRQTKIGADATQRELELEYKQRQAADESVRLAGQGLARVEAERDEMHRQLSEQAITLAGVEAARAALEAQLARRVELDKLTVADLDAIAERDLAALRARKER